MVTGVKNFVLMNSGTPSAIDALFTEAREFPPSAAFAAQANAKIGIYA